MIAEVLTSIKSISDRLGAVEQHLAIQPSAQARIDSPNPPSHSDLDAMAIDNKNSTEELTETKQQTWKIGDHTTAAHKLLLRWPSIQPLVQTRKCNIQENYVMKGEDRPILLLYGTGDKRFRDDMINICLLYTSPSPRDGLLSRMPSSA